MIKTVLCIDDDPIALMVIEICLKKSNFAEKIIKMESAKQALEYYNNIEIPEDIPGIVFLDINMPVLNGWDYIDEFTQQFPQFAEKEKIVILSSSVDPYDKEKAVENPLVKMFIPKPISVETLLEIRNS